MREADRIINLVQGEVGPEVFIRISADASDPKKTLNRISNVYACVAGLENAEWPDDGWWENKLPDWLLPEFSYSLEELRSRPDSWDFGSWIDATKVRGWEWWSSLVKDNSIEINVVSYEDPYSIEPLFFIIRAAGGRSIELHY